MAQAPIEHRLRDEQDTVERLPDQADRRTKQLRLTPEGEKVLEEIFAIADESRNRLLEGVAPEAMDELNTFLVMLTDRLDAGLPEPSSNSD